jgi:hypothetical protein
MRTHNEPSREYDIKESYSDCSCSHCGCHRKPDPERVSIGGAVFEEYRKPDPVEELVKQIQVDVYANVQANATCDMAHLNNQLRELVDLARRTK